MVLSLLSVALASAPNTPIVVNTPIAGGLFDTFGVAHPSYHHTPWGGDWATDVYGVPGSSVRFDVREWVPNATAGAPYGVVASNASSCASPYEIAGTAYRIDVYDGAGAHVGWVLLAHVDVSGVGLLPVGAVVPNGAVLGTTAQWAWSNCYQVTTPGGVHTHVELYNDRDYACYVPRASGTVMAAGRALGGLGTNKTSARQPCF